LLLIWASPEITAAFEHYSRGVVYQFHVELRIISKAPIFRRGNNRRSPESDLEARPLDSMRLAIPGM
jgi:hypothetical protein